MSDPISSLTGHAEQPKSTRGATWVTSPLTIVTTSTRTALASSLTNADIGYTVIDSDLTDVAGGELSVWVFAGETAGFIKDQRYTSGAANVYGMARNAVLVDSATPYNATQIFGFVCLVASGGASGGDATFTFVGDSTDTAINVIDVGTPVGEEKPWHLTALDPGTSGVFLAFIPDA